MIKKLDLRRLLLTTLGSTMVVLSLHFFLIPSHLAVGGASGLAILLSKIVRFFDTGQILLVLNVILFAMGFYFLGANFGFYTLYSALYLAGLLWLMESLAPVSHAVTDDTLINLIFGVGISSTGIAIVINQGASTGGTDIVAKIIEKYTRLSFGGGLMLTDGLITLGAGIIFSPKAGMYSLLGVVINSLVIDRFLQGFDSKFAVTIITKEFERVNNLILKDLNRGTTIYRATGGFSNVERAVLTTVLDRRSYVKLKQAIKEIDAHAFMYVSNVNEVEGEGFTFSSPE